MNSQKLIIYDFKELFEILSEIENELKFEILNVSKNNLLNELSTIKNNFVVISKKKIPDIKNQVFIDKPPVKILNFVERLNIEFLKKTFNEQSEISIGGYKLNLNSRELMNNIGKINLTEKETRIILYLSKAKTPIKIDELQSKVWGYHSGLETHTVETHVYRLRKKISKVFDDDNFIVSKKNGYEII